MVTFSLTLIRHGETAYNKDGIIQGQMDIPLSATGHQQAKLVAERLENTLFTHVYTSDLARANQTTQTIIQANKVCDCTVTKDTRLRERKFGDFEGKTSQELLSKAKNAVGPNRNWTEYTPPGAESYSQVQKRVTSFFRDLCTELVMYGNEVDETDYVPASITRRHGGSLGRGAAMTDRGGAHCRRSHSLCTISCRPADDVLNDSMKNQRKRKQENAENFRENDSDNSNDVENHNDLGAEINGNEDKRLKPCTVNNAASKSSSEELNMWSRKTEIGNIILPQGVDSDFGEKDSVKFYSPSSSASSTDSQGATRVSKSDEEWVTFQENDTCSTDDSDRVPTDIDNGNLTSNKVETFIREKSYNLSGSCPNVCISPPLQHPISSLSSISSGHNSSTCIDDLDINPPTIADVLLVSHGGFIKELLLHFTEELECKIPGGSFSKHRALKICPNCSISKFLVSLSSISEKPSVTCVCFNERDHLMGMSEAIGKY